MLILFPDVVDDRGPARNATHIGVSRMIGRKGIDVRMNVISVQYRQMPASGSVETAQHPEADKSGSGCGSLYEGSSFHFFFEAIPAVAFIFFYDFLLDPAILKKKDIGFIGAMALSLWQAFYPDIGDHRQCIRFLKIVDQDVAQFVIEVVARGTFLEKVHIVAAVR